MPKRPPAKGRGADIFLGEADSAPIKKRRTPKGQGADVFLGPEISPPQPKRPPLLAPAAMEAALDRVHQTLAPSLGPVDRSHLIVMLWLRVALKEACL
jgi:hypothetical protein